MKQYSRPHPPYSLNYATNDRLRRHIIGWYEKVKIIRNNDEIIAYWSKRKDIHNAVRDMSDQCCSYCGMKFQVGKEVAENKKFTVEHYLPKIPFRFLAYCWDNLFPSCRSCNEAKSRYVPQELQNRELIDPILTDREDFAGEAFHHAILQNIGERIFHPIVDNPEAHIDFDVANLKFIAKEGSSIGNITIGLILGIRHEATEFAEEIGERVNYIEKLFAEQRYQYNEILDLGLAEYEGYEFIVRKAVDYWAQFYIHP